MNIEILRIDDFGRGIGYINDKIIFVPKALPGDVIGVEITLEKKKFYEGSIINIIKESDLRKKSDCPYFDKCGGCSYLNLSYNDSLKIKEDNIVNSFKRNGFEQNILINKNDDNYNYRNKITLKIVNGKIGFYSEGTNTLVEIEECLIASNILNKYVLELRKLNITNGSVTIRCNYKNDVLISINTKNKVDVNLINKEDVIGIVLNDEVVHGQNYFVDKLLDLEFEVMYNSFFQVNPYVTEEIIKLLKKNITKEDIVLDLYCGVGTLSINAALKAKKVYGIEIVKNAVINARNNALINNIDNAEFSLGNLSKSIKVKDKINTFIVDPPRSGLDKLVIDKINEIKPNKIIYISCNHNTLIRDLKLLKDDYDFDYVAVYDMFSYTYHTENFVILKRK